MVDGADFGHNARTLFGIGASLTAARESHGLTIADAEKLTCLRARYLEALEAERFDQLPGHVYARAFLRTYADALGLDADMFVNEFSVQFPEPEEEPLLMLPSRRRRFPYRLALLAIGALAAVAAIAWSGSSHPKHVPPLTPHVARAAHKRVHVQAPKPKVVAVKPVPKPKPTPLLIRAVAGDCWLLVRRGGESGPVLYEGFLRPGEALHFRVRVWMRLGAPWNVVVRRGVHTFSLSRHRAQNLVA